MGGLVAALALAGCGANPAGQSASSVPTTTAPVVRTDIVSTRQLDGTLTYAGAYTIVNQLPGVFTAVPAPGAVITHGQALYRVNGRPVVLLYGTPEWRPLGIGAVGSDVRQLERNLVGLGFANASNLTVDSRYDWRTAAAVRRLQAALGEPATGIVGFGDVVYEPGVVRVADVLGQPGEVAQPGTPALTATSQQHVVEVQLGVDQQTLVKAGDAVTVTLPDGRPAAATVAAIGTVATTPPTGPNGASPVPTVTVTVALADPSAGGTLDAAPVTVSITSAKHLGVLAVPVMALLARPGGTYAVEVVDGVVRHLVAVTLGLFDDRGLVEVQGADLHEGMLVEVPVG